MQSQSVDPSSFAFPFHLDGKIPGTGGTAGQQIGLLLLLAAAAFGQTALIDVGGPTDPGAVDGPTPSATFTVPAALMPVSILPPGTNDATMRYGPQFAYDVVVPQAGLYRVTLYFIEPAVQQPRQRVFSVTANDTPILTDLDLAATAGYLVPTARQAIVAVMQPDLWLVFTAKVRSAVVSRIVVDGPFSLIFDGP